MHIFYTTRSNTVRLCCLTLLVIFVAVVLFTLQGETEDFPSNDEIPASIYGDSHGNKELLPMRVGKVFWSRTYVHCHALAYAHWSRRGFHDVQAYTGRADMGRFPFIRKHRDKKTAYFRNGCRAIADLDVSYHLIGPNKVQWIASYRIWDQTGAKIGQVNRQGLGYPLEDDMNLPEGDMGDAGGSGNVRLATTTGYEVTAGTAHEASITTDAPYYSIIWSITSPGQTEPDTVAETDQGDGTTTEAKTMI